MICVGRDAIKDFFEIDCAEMEANTYAMTCCRFTKKEQQQVVIIRFRSVEDISYHNITHECGHLGIDVFEVVGMPVTSDSSEAFCYLTGWAAECCAQMKKHSTGDDEGFTGRLVFDTESK
jgi:hypothetical protein